MQEMYTINHVALMSGLSSRTIRNYMKMGFLDGEMINGVWHFDAATVSGFFANPAVAPAIRAKRNALIDDFLSNEWKKENAVCTVMDCTATLEEANALSEYFCDMLHREAMNGVDFGFSFNGTNARVILKGPENAIRLLMEQYYSAKGVGLQIS